MSIARTPFGWGDAIVFISHKPHHVAPVESGERRCLVIELWEGEERACAHRCSVRRGSCLLSVAPARLVSSTVNVQPAPSSETQTRRRGLVQVGAQRGRRRLRN